MSKTTDQMPDVGEKVPKGGAGQQDSPQGLGQSGKPVLRRTDKGGQLNVHPLVTEENLQYLEQNFGAVIKKARSKRGDVRDVAWDDTPVGNNDKEKVKEVVKPGRERAMALGDRDPLMQWLVALAKADGKRKDLRGDARNNVEPLDRLIESAEAKAAGKLYEKAVLEINLGLDKAVKECERLSQEAEKARPVYLKARKAAEELLWKARELPGYPADAKVGEAVAKIEADLKEHDEAVEADPTREKYETHASVAKETAEGLYKEAKEASDGFKKGQKKDREAYPKFAKQRQKVEDARRRMADLPGAKEAVEKLDTALKEAAAKVDPTGATLTGSAAALEVLDAVKLDEIEKAARQESKQVVAKGLPSQAAGGAKDLQDLIGRLAEVAPAMTVQDHQKKCNEWVNEVKAQQGTPGEAVLKLVDVLKEDVQKEIGAAVQAESECRNLLQQLDGPIQEVDALDKEKAGLLRLEKAAAGSRMEQKRYADAKLSLEACLKEANALKKDIPTLRTVADTLKQADDLLKVVGQWPPNAGPAAELREGVKALRAEATTAADDRKARADELLRKARELDASARDKTGGASVSELAAAWKAEGAKVEEARARAEAAIRDLALGLGCADATRLEEHKTYTDLLKKWDDKRSQMTSENPGRIADLANEAVQKLDELAKQADDWKAPTTQTGQQLLMGKQRVPFEQRKIQLKGAQSNDEMAEAIRADLVNLERLGGGTEAKDLRTTLGKIVDQKDLQTQEKLLTGLATKVTRAVVALLKTMEEKRNEALTKVREAAALVQDEAGNYPDHKPFFEEVRGQLADLNDLARANDHDLIIQAGHGADRIKERVTKLTAKKAASTDEPSLKDVGGKVGEIGQKLASKSDDTLKKLKGEMVLKTFVPETYARLEKEYKDAVKLAVRDPEAGYKALTALEGPISDATAKAERNQINAKVYEALVKDLKKRIEDVAGKQDSLKAKFAGGLVEAEALVKTEDGFPPAIQRLDRIKAALDDIDSTPEDQRAEKLKSLDVGAQKEQEEIVKLIDEYKVRKKAAEELIALAKKAIDEAGDEGDPGEVDTLKKQLSRAGIPIKAYKKDKLKKAPDIAKARRDFQAAVREVARVESTARKIRQFPRGTDVRLVGDLDRAGRVWAAAAQAFRTALNDLGKQIGEAAKGDAEEVVSAGSKVAVALRDAAVDFSPDLFDADLKVLGSKAEAGPKRKAARERVLAKVRQARRALTESPFLRAACDPANPFLDVGYAASVLDARLKEVELESLVGV